MQTLSQITSQTIQHRAETQHEPRWLRQERLAAWKQFESLPDPDWKRTKIPKVDLTQSLILAEVQNEAEVGLLKIEKKTPHGTSGKIVIVDGRISRISLKPELAVKGVIFSDMKTAVLERADLLEKYFASEQKPDKFSALQTSLWENGYFLFVPQGLVIDEPFQIQIIQQKPMSILNRNLIILDGKSEAVVEESFESDSSCVIASPFICSTQTEVFAEADSRLKYYSLQNWSKNIYDFATRRLTAKKDARINALFSILGASAGKISVTGEAVEPGASIEHDAITIGTDDQKFKITASMNHRAEHTEGMMRYKSILKDQSYSYLDGLIKVIPEGKKAQSRLEEHTLILGNQARCDALPALDIQTSDVQVSHSAAVTKADEEKVFYAMSRGLSEEEARNLIIQGFFENLLETVKDPKYYEQLKAMIDDKIFTVKSV